MGEFSNESDTCFFVSAMAEYCYVFVILIFLGYLVFASECDSRVSTNFGNGDF